MRRGVPKFLENMAAELFGKANDEFVSENYQRAVELYSDAIRADDSKDEFYINRAQAFIKLEKYTEAHDDCHKALSINPKNIKAYLRKGVSLFHLKDYRNAIDAFREGKALDTSDSTFQNWLDKCEAELPPMSQVSSPESTADKQETVSAAPPAEPVKSPSKPKIRYDWYQTATHVIVTVLIKNVKKDDFTADIRENTLDVTIKKADDGDNSLSLNLANPIVPEQSSFKVMSTKVEIKLKKQEGLQWVKLEGDGHQLAAKTYMAAPPPATAAPSHQYPSSSISHRDWDKLAAEVTEEEKTEKKEGDAALNSLFQQIYSDGTDEVKRAMIKSFYESGGTVLSTNWSEVGKEKVDVKPPDGMEWKKY